MRVPVWYIYVGDARVDGPYYFQTAALMRLSSFPNGRVEKEYIEVEA